MRKLMIAVLALSLATAEATAAGLDSFTSFVGFGDSFSDKGRITTLGPPSLEGRFSNAPTWYERIGRQFARRGLDSFNMALGGATAGPVNTNDPRYLAYDAVVPTDPTDPDSIPLFELRNFDAQITSFVSAGFSAMVGDNPLVAVLLGANDFLQDPTRYLTPQTVVDDIVAGVRRVASLGGVFDSFIVSNLPDFSLSPGSALLPPAARAALSLAVQDYNARLEISLAALAATDGLEIEVFDLFGTFNDIFADAVGAGLVTDLPCTPDLLDPAPLFNLCPTPESADAFLFVDNIHVNGFAQSRVGDAALAQIGGRLAPVPLPAGLPLLLAGVGLLAAIRSRRTA